MNSYRNSSVGLLLLSLAVVGAFPSQSLALPVSGAVVWFDASDFDGDGNPGNNPLTGTNISTWVDKAGTVQGLQSGVQGTVANQPTYTNSAQNGQAALTFTAGNKFLTTPNLSMGSLTYFTVFQSTGASAIIAERGANLNVGGVNGEFLVSTTGHTFAVKRPGGDSRKDYVANWGNNSTWTGAAWLFDGTDVSQRLVVNGTQVALTVSSVNPGVAPVSEPLFIGARTGGAAGFIGNISELIAFDSSLNSARLNIMNNYIASRYNTALAAPVDFYAGDTALKGEYDFDVIGIGEEADGSNITSSGAGLTIAEAAGSLDTGEYLLAGQKTAVNSINPDGTWARVWYVDKTATSGIDANLTFDFSDAGLSVPPLGVWSQLALVYSPTDPFNFSSLGVGGIVSGDAVSFLVPNSQLLDGYYTLQAVTVPEPTTFALLGLGAIGMAGNMRRRRATKHNDIAGEVH